MLLIGILLCSILFSSCYKSRTVSYSREFAKTVKDRFSYVDELEVVQSIDPWIPEHDIYICKKDWNKTEAEEVYRFIIGEWLEHYKDTAIREDEIVSANVWMCSKDHENKTRFYLSSEADTDFQTWHGTYYKDIIERYTSEVFEYTPNSPDQITSSRIVLNVNYDDAQYLKSLVDLHQADIVNDMLKFSYDYSFMLDGVYWDYCMESGAFYCSEKNVSFSLNEEQRELVNLICQKYNGLKEG